MLKSIRYVLTNNDLSVYFIILILIWLLLQLKVDKTKLIELSGSSEDEFSSVRSIYNVYTHTYINNQSLYEILMLESIQVCTSMKDLCHDVFGVSQEKKDPKSVKGNRGKN